MTNRLKLSIATFVTVVTIGCVVAWLSGYNFDHRSSDVGAGTVLVLVLALVAVGLVNALIIGEDLDMTFNPGSFRIHANVIKERPHTVASLFAYLSIVPVRCEALFIPDCVEYLALSPRFQPRFAGEIATAYNISATCDLEGKVTGVTIMPQREPSLNPVTFVTVEPAKPEEEQTSEDQVGSINKMMGDK